MPVEEELKRYKFLVKDAKRCFSEWDMCDPVAWALLRVVQAQNGLAGAINMDSECGATQITERAKAIDALEAAITERREAIDALCQALEQEPRGFQ